MLKTTSSGSISLITNNTLINMNKKSHGNHYKLHIFKTKVRQALLDLIKGKNTHKNFNERLRVYFRELYHWRRHVWQRPAILSPLVAST